MITFDGDRSKNRRWFAKKQLAVIKAIDVPSKAVMWEGFTFRVWQQKQLDGGRVTAPMGAVVICSNQQGNKIAVSDSWVAAFGGAKDLYTLFYEVDDNSVQTVFIAGADEAAMIEAGYQTILFKPMVSLSPFGLDDGETIGGSTEWVADLSCTPQVMPYLMGEKFVITFSDNVFYDLNNNGIADWPKTICESVRIFYSRYGKELGKRYSVAFETGAGVQPWMIMQQITPEMRVIHHTRTYYLGENDKICFRVHFDTAEVLIYMSWMIPPSSMPAALRTLLLAGSSPLPCVALGSYAFSLDGAATFLHVVNATSTPYAIYAGSTTEEYFDANPTDDEWKLFYSWWTEGAETATVVNSDQFIGLLDALATIPILAASGVTKWRNARRMLEQLIGAFPNNDFNVPYDSFMFHAHDRNIYTWTRAYGAVKFTQYGIFAEPIYVPPEVLNEEGVRPEISYAGTYDAIPTYLCVCNKPAVGVRAVYIGSPFETDGWAKLPGTDVGQELLHARPVKVTLSEVFLIGVVRFEAKYYFATLTWQPGSMVLWKKQGKLPFSAGNYDNFSVGLYGNDTRVADLAEYLSPPAIVPQMPVGPYSLYSVSQP